MSDDSNWTPETIAEYNQYCDMMDLAWRLEKAAEIPVDSNDVDAWDYIESQRDEEMDARR